MKNLGVQLFAISPDQPSKLKESIDKHKMGFRLLSDSDMAAARSFRVAYQLDDATLAQLKKYGIDVVTVIRATDEQHPEWKKLQAGEDAYRAATRAKQLAREAEEKIRQAGREARDGWEDAKHNDPNADAQHTRK